jgi:hypothetical protein
MRDAIIYLKYKKEQQILHSLYLQQQEVEREREKKMFFNPNL